jgi:hypothetical protein
MMERAMIALLLRAYPSEFRTEYGDELRQIYRRLMTDARAGMAEGAVLWVRLAVDALRSAPAQWLAALRTRRDSRPAHAPDHAGAVCAAFAVFALYWLTLAPTAALWDAGEYITVSRVLGIPHPPGNSLFVLLGRAWDVLLAPTGWPTAVRINVLSALCSAAAHGFLYLCMHRMLAGEEGFPRRLAAALAVMVSATAFTVWNQSNVNEKVYTISFLTVLWTVWLALRWRDTGRTRLLLVAAYMTALSMTNHLMGALVAPAVLLFVWRVDRRVLMAPRVWALTIPAVLLALSAQFFLPIRAAQQPLVNEADPSCATLSSAAASIYTNGAEGCSALSATLQREQYAKPSILSDPARPDRPRDAGLLGAQLLNYVQYVDWQWARSIAGSEPLLGGWRPLITLLFLLFSFAGARAHWRADRDGALLQLLLFGTLSAGLVFYLNFRYGYTIARDAYPAGEMHEVRERDYFFLISFSVLGAWIGAGIVATWHALSRALLQWTRHARLAAAPLLVIAAVPLALNWSWASRAHDWTARDWAYNVLMSVEPYGVLITNGDNDSFPLWYLQHVERIREDVTIVLSPYIGTDWYARQIRSISQPCPPGADASSDDTRIICQRPFRAEGVHAKLLAAWGGAPQVSPEDSILPMSDAEIAGMAQTMFVTDRPLEMRFGEMRGHIASGTLVTPVDTFVAAIIQHTYGARPIHFMSPSPIVDKLGLAPHTVRVGLTWKLREPADGDAYAFPAATDVASLGSYIDLVTTDTLAREVFVVRGRINNPALPWVDHASLSIPLQYAVMHYAAAVAHELRGDVTAAQHHGERLTFWNRVIGG